MDKITKSLYKTWINIVNENSNYFQGGGGFGAGEPDPVLPPIDPSKINPPWIKRKPKPGDGYINPNPDPNPTPKPFPLPRPEPSPWHPEPFPNPGPKPFPPKPIIPPKPNPLPGLEDWARNKDDHGLLYDKKNDKDYYMPR